MKRLLTGFLMGTLSLGAFTPVIAQEIVETVPLPETEIPAVFELPILEETSVPTSTEPAAEATEETAPAAEMSTTTPLAETFEAAEETVEILVKFKEKGADLDLLSGRRALASALEETDTTLETKLSESNIAVVSVSADENVAAVISELENNAAVEYAEPNYARSFSAIATNDTLRANQWALENTGQTVSGLTGTPDADIDAPEAWNLSLGTSTVVAVIDNGVLYTHPDLANNMWDGTGCVVAGTSSPCDHGYDFDDHDSSPLPLATSTTDTYHGTHVAGIIAAEMNNATGTIGVAPKAKIMALRFGLDVASEVEAIDFAIANGAKIINASFGGTQFSQAEYDAIARFRDAGGIFIAAAGNGGDDSLGDDTDSSPIFPASYDLTNIVSVAATSVSDDMTTFSNYGATTVDLGAPGHRIWSTIATDGITPAYNYLSGTSMAAPYVAGTAALLLSKYASSTVKALKSALLNSGDTAQALSGKSVSGKRLNAFNALQYLAADLVAPVITRTGAASVSLTVGDTYTDLGATAEDDIDASVAVIATSTVNTAVAGTYTVSYDATDLAGNHAQTVTRTVIVSAAPVNDPPRRRSGGGGGGGGSSRATTPTAENPARTLFTGPATGPYASMTPEQRTALLNVLVQLLTKLQAQLAALRAQGL